MSKNLIYIVNITDPSATIDVNEYSRYCINTWKYWCRLHNIDLIVNQTPDPRFKKPIWNKELIYRIGKDYDKIGIVDSDTMIKWDSPNIFETVTEFHGVNDLADLNWILDSIKQRRKFFPNVQIDLMKYINAGVLFFTNEYLPIFKKLLDFYLENESEIIKLTTGGKEQTLLNFVLQENNVPIRLLDPSWNLFSIHRKNMFTNNWQLQADPTNYFIKYGYIWHFTGFPIEDRIKIMEQTWNAVKHNYQ